MKIDRTAVILQELADRWEDLTAKEAEQLATVLQEYADYVADQKRSGTAEDN